MQPADIFPALAERGVEELVVRVSRYGSDGRPEAWQAIARYRNRLKGPWGVGVRASPLAAVVAALDPEKPLTGPVQNVCHGDIQQPAREDPFA